MAERLGASFAARDWAALAEMVADDICNDDRRRVVSGGIRHGRDAEIADMRATADIGVTNVTSTVIATRGERLALSRYRFSGRDPRPEAFHAEMLGVVEINADNRIAARIWFDPDDNDAAFEELDARYLAGEAAAHAHAWSVVAQTYAALNRRELPETTPDWVNVDRRRPAPVEAGDIKAYLSATWDLTAQSSIHIESVHQLTNLGAVVTHAAHATTHEHFDAEWRVVTLLTVEGDLINRCEMFEEDGLDAALTRFDELSAPAPALENSATRTWARLADAFNRRDLDDFVALTRLDGHFDDRRKGLRDSHDGSMRRRVAQTLFDLPSSWRSNRACRHKGIAALSDPPDHPRLR